MSRSAQIYVAAVMVLSAVTLSYNAAIFHCDSILQFITFAIAAGATAGMKVQLPVITGTLSVNTVFVFFAITQLTGPEVVIIAAASAIVQTLWKPKVRARLVQVAFNASSVAVAAWIADQTFHLWVADAPLLLKLCSVAAAYFVVNTSSIAVIVALTENRRLVETWRTCYFWSFPYFLVAAIMAATMQFVARAFGWEVGLGVIPFLLVIYRSYQLYLNQLTAEKEHAEGLASLHMRTIEALALAIEAKDHTTGEHLQRVQVYAREMGKALNLSADDQLALQAAAILHDIGKLAVPDYIISKPGKLTVEEFEKMKIHPVVGAEILERIDFPYPVVPIVRAHHEKWDGSGYPYGLKGEEIPIGARILTALDCLDALASDRQYRRAIPLEDAMGILVAEAGKSFDPTVVEILNQRYRDLEKLARNEPAMETAVLSVETKLERGESPDAGFESDGAGGPQPTTEGDFLTAIASARQEAQLLFEFTTDLGNSLSLKETLSIVATRISRLVAYEAIAIYIKENTHLIPFLVSGENQKLFESLRIPVGEGLSGWVVENVKPIINGNPSVEPGYLQDNSKFSTLRSALAVPLRTEAGAIGVIGLYRTAKDAFSRDDLRIVLALSSKISIAVENALSYQDANTRARVDGLTGLPNATALFLHLESEMARCSRAGSTLTILVSDLDGFKQINDRQGHLVGNQVLKRVAEAFRSCCREYDYVGRMGGDEFVFVLPGMPAEALPAKIEQVGDAVRAAASGIDPNLSVSLGCAVYPDDGTEAETLLAEADRRMYGVKRRRKENPVPPDGSRSLLSLGARVSNGGPPTITEPVAG